MREEIARNIRGNRRPLNKSAPHQRCYENGCFSLAINMIPELARGMYYMMPYRCDHIINYVSTVSRCQVVAKEGVKKMNLMPAMVISILIVKESD